MKAIFLLLVSLLYLQLVPSKAYAISASNALWSTTLDCNQDDAATLEQNYTITEIAKICLKKNPTLPYETFEEYLVELKQWNPHLKGHELIPEGSKLYLHYPGPYYNYRFAEPLSMLTLDREEKKDPTLPRFNRFGLGFFVVNSQSRVTEKIAGSSVSLISTQHSPWAAGSYASFKPAKNHFFLTASVYLSSISSTVTQGSLEPIEFPYEVGSNFYLKYHFKSIGFIPYIGVDYEKLSTYNFDDVINNGSATELRTHQNYYYTAGVNQLLSFRDTNFSLIVSYSTSFKNKSKQGAETIIGYEGNKYIVHLTYLPGGSFSYSVFYKEHNLTGSSAAQFQRAGIGLNYNLL
jgi:hypothetical protein